MTAPTPGVHKILFFVTSVLSFPKERQHRGALEPRRRQVLRRKSPRASLLHCQTPTLRIARHPPFGLDPQCQTPARRIARHPPFGLDPHCQTPTRPALPGFTLPFTGSTRIARHPPVALPDTHLSGSTRIRARPALPDTHLSDFRIARHPPTGLGQRLAPCIHFRSVEISSARGSVLNSGRLHHGAIESLDGRVTRNPEPELQGGRWATGVSWQIADEKWVSGIPPMKSGCLEFRVARRSVSSTRGGSRRYLWYVGVWAALALQGGRWATGVSWHIADEKWVSGSLINLRHSVSITQSTRCNCLLQKKMIRNLRFLALYAGYSVDMP